MVFVEDDEDFRLIRRFASVLGYPDLAAGIGITAVRSEGFSAWSRIESVGWGVEKSLGTQLQIAAVFDHDYYCQQELDSIVAQLQKQLAFVHIHERKEMENYLLEPVVITRALQQALRERSRRRAEKQPEAMPAEEMIDQASADLKSEVIGHYAAEKHRFLRSSGKDQATIISEVTDWVEDHWHDIPDRMQIVPGKLVLRRLRTTVQDRYGVTLTSTRIVNSFAKRLVPDDMRNLVAKLEDFRTGATRGRGE